MGAHSKSSRGPFSVVMELQWLSSFAEKGCEKHVVVGGVLGSLNIVYLPVAVVGTRMSHRKLRETKQQLS